MSPALLADLVLLVHLTFVLFVVAGAFAVLRWPRLMWLHLPAVAWGAFIEFSGRVCPLTPLENDLRLRAGESTYSGGFIDHYVTAMLYPDGLTRPMQVALGALVLVLNAAIYWRLWRRHQLKSSRHSTRTPTRPPDRRYPSDR